MSGNQSENQTENQSENNTYCTICRRSNKKHSINRMKKLNHSCDDCNLKRKIYRNKQKMLRQCETDDDRLKLYKQFREDKLKKEEPKEEETKKEAPKKEAPKKEAPKKKIIIKIINNDIVNIEGRYVIQVINGCIKVDQRYELTLLE